MSKLFNELDYKLYIAGKEEGDYYTKLLNQIKDLQLEDKIIFKGMVIGREKEQLYAEAKATFLISHSENFGNVIIESLAQGTPVIASFGTPWKILEQKGCGFWIDNSPEIIARTIDRIISLDEVQYDQMRNNAYNLCQEQFDIKTNINKWIENV